MLNMIQTEQELLHMTDKLKIHVKHD